MFYAGIDAHMKSSTIWIVDRKGRKVSSSTVMTSAEGFAAGLGRWVRRGLKAAVEASGITPWVCQLLKDLGVRVVVVNPNRVRLIAESRKKPIVWTPKPWRSYCDWAGYPKYISHRWKRAGCVLS